MFLSQDFWVDSPVSQAPGSHFEMLITQPKSKKYQNGQGHLHWDQEEPFGGKNGIQKIV